MPSRYDERRKNRQTAAATKRRNKAAAEEVRATRARNRFVLKTDRAAQRRDNRQRDDKDKTKRRKERHDKARRIYRALTSRVSLPVLVVVAVSMVMAWYGQIQAAVVLGLGFASLGVPFISEGLTLAFAQQAEAAVREGRPALRWRVLTVLSGMLAAGLNYYGHATLPAGVVDDITDERQVALQQEADVRAAVYAVASLAGLVAWEASLWAKAAKRKGTTSVQKRRARARRLRYPRVVWRASQLRVLDPRLDADTAFALAWERCTGAPFGHPSRREILRQRRAHRLRVEAEQWDGTRTWCGLRRTRSHTDANAVSGAVPGGALESVPDGVPLTVLGPAMAVPSSARRPFPTGFHGPAPGLKFQYPTGEGPGWNWTATPAGYGVTPTPGTATGNATAPAPVGKRNGIGARFRKNRGRSEEDWQRSIDQALKVAPRLIEEARSDKRKQGRGGSLLSPYSLAGAVGMRRGDGPELLRRLQAQHGPELQRIADQPAAEPPAAGAPHPPANGNGTPQPEGGADDTHPLMPVNGDGDRRPEPVTSR